MYNNLTNLNKNKLNKVMVIPLTYLLQQNKKAINLVSNDLQTRGFSFIRLPDDLDKQIDACMLNMKVFFSQNQEYKNKYNKNGIFGYFPVKHKESFRLLTGSRLNEFNVPISELKNLIQTVDQIMYTLTLALSTNLFPNIFEKSKELDIPMFNMKKQWGMFDIAKYHNDGTRMELNCKEHCDPGLFSLSLRSSAPGLQLKNEFGDWVASPNNPENKNVAILWAGRAANTINPKVKVGIHRVINVPNRPRISMWHEVCLAGQEHKEYSQEKISLFREQKIEKKFVNPKKFEDDYGYPITKSLSRESKIEKKFVNPKKFEDDYGYPITKSM